MRAVTQHRYGGTDQLATADVPVPSPGPGEVLVRVEAAGVDRGVWHLMTGLPRALRFAGFGVRAPRRRLGMDLAGTVVEVGDGVVGFAVGDPGARHRDRRVRRVRRRPAAQLVRTPAVAVRRRAAALPISGLTALQAVRAAGVVAGQSVLVLGAAGGVGSYAVQVARHRGAEVTGVCSAAKTDLVRSLGAPEVIDYDPRGDGPRTGGGTTSILDIAGTVRYRCCAGISRPPGRW